MAISAAAATAIAGALAAAGSVGSAGISSARNMKIAKYSADFQRQQIAEQNLYNSPLSQMKRYQEAGLNPQLIYNEGQAISGNQSQVARYETPELPTPDFGPMLGSLAKEAMEFALMKKEIALRDQELANKREEQFNMRSSRMGQDIQNAYMSVLTGFDPGLVMDVSARDQILNSKRMTDYNLGLQTKEVMNALHNAQKELATVDYKYRDRILNEMVDLQKDLLKKQIEGKDMDNAILQVEKELQQHLNQLGGKGGVKLIVDFLRAIFR